MKITAAVSREDEPSPRLEVIDLEGPQVGEVRVRMVATGICHTDMHFHGAFGSRFASKPMVLGHEGAGVVDAVGVGVRDVQVGDHVVLAGSSCGHCPSCHAGLPGYCSEMIRYCWSGMRPDGSSPLSQDGGRVAGYFFGQSSFATHAIVSQRTTVKVPKDVPLHLLGPLCCGVITGAGSVLEAFRVRPGQSIAVLGTGGVGFSALMASRLAGASHIVAVDVNRQRLDLALELGATDAVPASADTASVLRGIRPAGFDFTLITAQAPELFDIATSCLAVQGTAGFVIEPRSSWTPDMLAMLVNGRKLQGIIGGNANPKTFIPMLIEYWRQGRFPFDRLIAEFPFERFSDAWEAFRGGQVIKPVLRM